MQRGKTYSIMDVQISIIVDDQEIIALSPDQHISYLQSSVSSMNHKVEFCFHYHVYTVAPGSRH